MNEILKYFPDLTPAQRRQFEAMGGLYREWNSKINLVSRKDIDMLYLHHILHSLSVARVVNFRAGTNIIDVGCGGGFPGIPLAVMFPGAQFTLVDSIGKKIGVVRDIARELGLQNVEALHCRAEDIDRKFDFAVSRAVTDMPRFLGWVWKKITPGGINALPNGVLYLKGGDLAEELAATKKSYMIYDIEDFFEEDFFKTKKIVYFQR